MRKVALITGVTGQDGSYLAEFLLKKNYKIIGTIKNIKNLKSWRLKRLNIEKKITLSELNLNSKKSIDNIFKKYYFNEFYNLAGHSVVTTSFKDSLNTANNTAMGVIRILNAIKKSNKNIKFYLDPYDRRFIPIEIINFGAFEPLERDVLDFMASQSRVIVDVGANIGWYTMRFAKVESVKHVFAFEASSLSNSLVISAKSTTKPYL